MNIIVLIPAFNPDQQLVELVLALLSRASFREIIVVNDGSQEESDAIFAQLAAFPGLQVLNLPVNSGKGAALKFGLDYVYRNFSDCVGVVSADADGQHLPGNILEIAKTLIQFPGSLILGARSFDRNVPARSQFGNRLTRTILALFFRLPVTDTQTGLRGIPVLLIPSLLTIPFDGYEFELEMLLMCQRSQILIKEVPIETVYLDHNNRSHFHPVFDSMKIYFVLFRYVIASGLSSLLDFILFVILYRLTGQILMTILIGRYTIGALVNFMMNKRFVFRYEKRFLKALFHYYILATVSGAAAFLLIKILFMRFGMNVIMAKILVESVLFVVNFVVQRDIIFKKKLVVLVE